MHLRFDAGLPGLRLGRNLVGSVRHVSGALPSEKEWKFNTGRDGTLQARRNVRIARRFSQDEEATTMDPKTRESKKRRPKAERPPATARTPKDGESQDPGDIERATQRDERDFDPNVNQPPR
jgi:hypothetical protein